MAVLQLSKNNTCAKYMLTCQCMSKVLNGSIAHRRMWCTPYLPGVSMQSHGLRPGVSGLLSQCEHVGVVYQCGNRLHPGGALACLFSVLTGAPDTDHRSLWHQNIILQGIHVSTSNLGCRSWLKGHSESKECADTCVSTWQKSCCEVYHRAGGRDRCQ